MKSNSITIIYSLMINNPREIVLDFTQNYDNRMTWDDSVKAVSVLQESPNRIVKLKLKSITIMTMIYKLDDRPVRTSLVAKEVDSPVIQRADSSWAI